MDDELTKLLKLLHRNMPKESERIIDEINKASEEFKSRMPWLERKMVSAWEPRYREYIRWHLHEKFIQPKIQEQKKFFIKR